MTNKWGTEGWGAAQRQIREAVLVLFRGKSRPDCQEIAEELVGVIRALARGDEPPLQTSAFDREAHAREGWARQVASGLVGVAMRATERSEERLPSRDQVALLREIAKLALWHMPNAPAEATQIARIMTIEGLKQPHPGDDPAPEI